eukprot:Skav225344  [mRNA]  locus=scaffold3721:50896:58566:+ [translate_table: standard]
MVALRDRTNSAAASSVGLGVFESRFQELDNDFRTGECFEVEFEDTRQCTLRKGIRIRLLTLLPQLERKDLLHRAAKAERGQKAQSVHFAGSTLTMVAETVVQKVGLTKQGQR